MLVIKSGFERVGEIAIANGLVAATKGTKPGRMTAEDISAIFRLGPPTPAIEDLRSAPAWEAKVWSLPPEDETLHAQDWDDMPFGLVLDPRAAQIIHGTVYGHIRSSVGWELENGGGPLRTIALSPDGTRLVCATEWHPVMVGASEAAYPSQLWSYTRGRTKTKWRPEAADEFDGFVFSHLAFLPDSKRFAAIQWSKKKCGGQFEQGDSPTLKIHDVKSLREVASAKFKRPADALTICGERIVVQSGNRLKVWELPHLVRKPMEVKTADEPSAVAADAHGRFLLTASGSSVSVWDAKTWTVAKTYDWKAGPITCLAVAPDGLTAAAGTATGKVVVWDLE